MRTPARPLSRSFWRGDAGSVAVEFAIVGLAMIIVCVGIIEVGRGLYVRNQLSFVADQAARIMLMSGDTSAKRQEAANNAEKAAREAFTAGTASLLQVSIPPPAAGDEFVTIGISYPFETFLPCPPGFQCPWKDGISLNVDREVPLG